jgi:hypothetical protein
MKAYKIKDWNLHFENNKSRERDLCSWCPIPNKQDGLGYGRLLSMKDGAAMYGAFVAVVLVASKQRKPRDGHLTDTGRADGCPLTADDLSIMSKVPSATIDKMLVAASDITIGWIDSYESGHTSARQVPVKCPSSVPLLKEGNEEKEMKRIEMNRMADFPKLQNPEFETAFDAWLEFRKAKKAPATDRVVHAVLSRLAERPDQAVAALDTCMVAGWTDVRWDWIDNRNSRQGGVIGKGGHADPDNDPLLRFANKTGKLGEN